MTTAAPAIATGAVIAAGSDRAAPAATGRGTGPSPERSRGESEQRQPVGDCGPPSSASATQVVGPRSADDTAGGAPGSALVYDPQHWVAVTAATAPGNAAPAVGAAQHARRPPGGGQPKQMLRTPGGTTVTAITRSVWVTRAARPPGANPRRPAAVRATFADMRTSLLIDRGPLQADDRDHVRPAVRAGAADHRPVRLVHRMLRVSDRHGSAGAANHCQAGVSCGWTLAERHTESPAKVGDDGVREPTAWTAGGFHTRSPRVSTRGFLGAHKAPGGSRGTRRSETAATKRMPSRVPCDRGPTRRRVWRATRRGGR